MCQENLLDSYPIHKNKTMSTSDVVEPKKKISRLPELIRVSLLYDYYGSLLAEKQREAIELYYLEDQTLGEIAKAQNVSRQAVFDALEHAIKTLENYESKLGLVKQQASENKSYLEVLSSIRAIIKEITRAGIIYDSDKLVDSLRAIEKKVVRWIQEKDEAVKEDYV